MGLLTFLIHLCKSSLFLENFLWLLVFGTFASLAILFSLEAFNHWQDNPVLTSDKTTGKLHRVWMKKMTHIFYFIAFLIIMNMIIFIHTLNDDTLIIPKW